MSNHNHNHNKQQSRPPTSDPRLNVYQIYCKRFEEYKAAGPKTFRAWLYNYGSPYCLCNSGDLADYLYYLGREAYFKVRIAPVGYRTIGQYAAEPESYSWYITDYLEYLKLGPRDLDRVLLGQGPGICLTGQPLSDYLDRLDYYGSEMKFEVTLTPLETIPLLENDQHWDANNSFWSPVQQD